MKRQYRKEDADLRTLELAEDLKIDMDEFFARDYAGSAARYERMAQGKAGPASEAEASYDTEPPPYERR
ncbi:MAG: hypothetical protein LAT81_12710, partial [Oceanicaulis sp.]|nr:hypothetical protein [Oceanicaulis sp.]